MFSRRKTAFLPDMVRIKRVYDGDELLLTLMGEDIYGVPISANKVQRYLAELRNNGEGISAQTSSG
jgi:hypothetical protein